MKDMKADENRDPSAASEVDPMLDDDDPLTEQFFSHPPPPPQKWDVERDYEARPATVGEQRAMHAMLAVIGAAVLVAVALVLFPDQLLLSRRPTSSAPLAAIGVAPYQLSAPLGSSPEAMAP